MEEYCIIKTAIASESLARTMIKKLLEKRLISCAQIFKIDSMYWWNDEIQDDKEFVIEMKTKKSLYSKVENEILKIHNYDVPEMVCIDIVNGYDRFLNWIDDETI